MLPPDSSTPMPEPPTPARASPLDAAGRRPAAGRSAVDADRPGPSPVAPRRHRSASSARGPILALAMVLVSVLAGGALFLSGFLVGQRRRVEQPGTPVRAQEQAFQPFWDSYDTIIKRFALGGDDRQQSLIDGAIKGMVDSLGDPYSAYLTPDEYRQGLQDLSGQFEGIGAEIGTQRREGRDLGLHDARAGLPPRRRHPDRGLAVGEGRGQGRRRSSRSTAPRSTG